jgi:tRNA pseudouridine(38-40) synthase
LRVALGLSYNGSSYEGWQSQLSGNTIQDRLEHALGQFTGQQFRVNCAGRTRSSEIAQLTSILGHSGVRVLGATLNEL